MINPIIGWMLENERKDRTVEREGGGGKMGGGRGGPRAIFIHRITGTSLLIFSYGMTSHLYISHHFYMICSHAENDGGTVSLLPKHYSAYLRNWSIV